MCEPDATVSKEIEEIMADMGWTWKFYDKPKNQLIKPSSIDSDEEFGKF